MKKQCAKKGTGLVQITVNEKKKPSIRVSIDMKVRPATVEFVIEAMRQAIIKMRLGAIEQIMAHERRTEKGL